MSEIQKALAEATDIQPSKRNNETITDQGYLKRLALGVGELSDDDWNKLDIKAQDWFNSAADAIEKKQDLPPFPDMEPAPAASRRRGSGSAAAEKPYTSKDAKKGDEVVVVNKRGKEYAGQVVEADDQGIVLDVDGKDVELDHDKIESIKLSSGGSGGGEGAADPEVPEVGDTVEVLTKRGKKIVANITEISDKDIVLTDSAGEIHEFDRDRLESIVVKVKNAGKGSASGKAGTKPEAAKKDEPAAKSTRTTAAANGGVSITTRIRELVADRLDAKKDDIAAILKKEGLEFKQATLDLTFSDMHKIVGILREKKLLK